MSAVGHYTLQPETANFSKILANQPIKTLLYHRETKSQGTQYDFLNCSPNSETGTEHVMLNVQQAVIVPCYVCDVCIQCSDSGYSWD
jgi:hypothetical protein